MTDEPWQAYIAKIKELNFDLATHVSHYEDSVMIQGTSKEDVQARVRHAKKREVVRRMVVDLHEKLMMRMAEGSMEEKKASFFTECYNYTSCVDRLKKGLERSMRKERKRIEANKEELNRIKNSPRITEEERREAAAQLAEVDQITLEKEALCK